MVQSVISNRIRNQLVSFLDRLVEPQTVSRGIELAESGKVVESYKTQSDKIHGVVRDDDDQTNTCTLTVLSSKELDAHCSCSRDENTWCAHTVALLWNAHSLGFFDYGGGFPAPESEYRINPNSARDIAAVIEDLGRFDNIAPHQAQYFPAVAIFVLVGGDRLGIQVEFDGEIHGPTLFKNLERPSSRSLDNLLLKILEDEGLWDEENLFFFVNHSQSIELLFGLLREFGDVRILHEWQEDSNANVHNKTSAQPLQISERMVEAQLNIEWHELSVELMMDWKLPDGSIASKVGTLIGTGPYWATIDNTIYRLSPRAARIAAIFPHSSTTTLSKAQSGPILEVLNNEQAFVAVQNIAQQPESEMREPTVLLELRRLGQPADSYAQARSLQIGATLDFEYPAPPPGKNLVYLPNREKERELIQQLRGLGFQYYPERRMYIIAGDDALDFFAQGKSTFDDTWKVSGYDEIKRTIKFSNLALNVNLQSSDDLGKINWFDCHIGLTLNNSNVPLSTLFKNQGQHSDRWVQLDNGSFARVPGGGVTQLKATLGMIDANYKLSNTIKAGITPGQAVSFTKFQDGQLVVSGDNRFRQLEKRFDSFSGISLVHPSKKFTGTLRPYQQEGLSWLHFLNEFECAGILADEMGLGKTVQTLAFIQHLRQKKSSKPCLVVCPTSLIANWCYEAQRFTPNLKTLALHGSNRKGFFTKLSDYDLIVTSYVLLRIDRKALERQTFSMIILDEAQNIKNPEAATTRAAKALKGHNRLALTGTPTENRPMELWSIFDFLMPGYLGSADFFRTAIEKPILESGPESTAGNEVAKLLRSKTKPFVLRRTKAEVEKDLPPKIESVLPVEMTESQMAVYSQVLEDVRPKIFDVIKEKGVRGASISILAALLRLRQICNHPNSIAGLRDVPDLDSGKFDLLKDLIEEALESGKKILVYSQFLDMLGIIRSWLEERSISHLYLDGSTKDRQGLVDKFNSDESIRLFLISLKAGGTGLNLTGADTVIIYDPWWNPAVENQAADRAHRIGQTKTVNVYRLVTQGTVESRIMELKEKKAKIVDALINENGLSSVRLTKGDIESLFAPLT